MMTFQKHNWLFTFRYVISKDKSVRSLKKVLRENLQIIYFALWEIIKPTD